MHLPGDHVHAEPCTAFKREIVLCGKSQIETAFNLARLGLPLRPEWLETCGNGTFSLTSKAIDV